MIEQYNQEKEEAEDNNDDRLLTMRAKASDAKETQLMRSLRKPDFLRTSLLSARKPNPRAKS